MKLIVRKETDPYFNIAAEEYFLKNFDDEMIMIWRSSPSVIIGKHQNTIAEVNINFVRKHNIPVIRRISGGGTVYHDKGNVNYSIITKSDNREKLVDFVKFTNPIIKFLEKFEIYASFEGKNNLRVKQKKFSGNSAHVYKNRVLHHGTLLFNTNIENLEQSIQPSDFSINDKAVKSVRAQVANLTDYLPKNITITDFQADLIIFVKEYFKIDSLYTLTKIDIQEINNLIETKYTLWEWNYGYSPTFSFQNKVEDYEISMEVVKGKINNIIIVGIPELDEDFISTIRGTEYNRDSISEFLSNSELNKQTHITIFKLMGLQE